VGFLVGQVLAWRELTMDGGGLTTSPAASFFYLLSGLHGLHILGGLAALWLVMSRQGADGDRLRLGTGLCVAYWDFLLVVWLGLLVLFTGGANRFVEICRGVLT
jgi:cytochrome c oxidase subunit 3